MALAAATHAPVAAPTVAGARSRQAMMDPGAMEVVDTGVRACMADRRADDSRFSRGRASARPRSIGRSSRSAKSAEDQQVLENSQVRIPKNESRSLSEIEEIRESAGKLRQLISPGGTNDFETAQALPLRATRLKLPYPSLPVHARGPRSVPHDWRLSLKLIRKPGHNLRNAWVPVILPLSG